MSTVSAPSYAQQVVPEASEPADTSAVELLDDEQVWQTFSQPADAGRQLWHSNVLVGGLHCAACASRVEQALRRVPGVLAAEVSAGSHRAKISWNADRTKPSHWMRAVDAAGYSLIPANDSVARERRLAESRRALWRMMVAGVCMMQIMMYAYPTYSAEPGELSAEIVGLLRWAAWVLSLPVLVFSCGPFFSSAWTDIRLRRISMDLPVALGMLITFTVSTLGTFQPEGVFGREVYFDSLSMFVFFLLTGRWFEVRLRGRTAGALEALMNRMPESVERQTDQGGFERVALHRLRCADVIRVLPGDAFPADGVVLTGMTEVDEALLTGESRPIPRGPGEEVIAGSHNVLGSVLMRVTKVAGQTRYAQVLALMQSASVSRPALARLADAIAKPFLIGVLLTAGAACAFWWRTDPEQALMVAVAVLVVTCPCALSLATPAALLAAAGALARQGVLVRDVAALEALAKVDTVVFDKTGTLTSGLQALEGVEVREGSVREEVLAMAGALAAHSRHPLSRALFGAAQAGKVSVSKWQVQDPQELPGQGIRGRVHRLDDNLNAKVLRLGSAAFCAPPTAVTSGTAVHLADDDGWLASFLFQETLHPSAPETIQAFREAGLSVQMLSGDSSEAASRIATTLRIDDVRSQASPEQKLDSVRQDQDRGQRVAFVGDGLNDGPVMAASSVSFAMGHAVPVARSRADFWIASERVSDTVVAYKTAKRAMRVVRQNLAWALAYNVVCVPLAVMGMLPAWLAGLGMAASSLLVVTNAWRLSRFAAPTPATVSV